MIVPPEGACTFHDPLNKCACCRAWQERVNELQGRVTVAERRERTALHLMREQTPNPGQLLLPVYADNKEVSND